MVAVHAQRGGTRPPAPLSPSTLLLHEGQDALLLVLALLLLAFVYVALKRRAAAWGKMSDSEKAKFK